jgi:hypothetical protein
MKEVLKHLVETTNATDAGCERHIGDWQSRFVKKLFGEEHPPGLGH